MKHIYSAASLPEAHLLLHWLHAEGIDAKVFNENAQGAVGELPFTHTYPEVWIERLDDEDRARSVIHQFEKRSVSKPGWYCQNCGEHNPATFEVCWQCASTKQYPD